MLFPSPVPRETYLVRFKASDPHATNRHGAGWYEADDDRTNRRDVVGDITGGQYADAVESVVELTPEGSWSDVTEDIAREVLAEAIDRFADSGYVELPNWLEEWLDEQLDWGAVAQALSDHESEYANAPKLRAGHIA